MKVILREDVKSLGKAGDVIEVKDGYARNYLIARNLAVKADAGHMRQLEHERKMLHDKKEKTFKEANKLAEKINKTSCTIAVQVGEEDKLFGSVTALDIVEQLAKEGVEVDKRNVQLEEPIRALGVFNVPVKIMPEVEAKLKLWVVKA
ncbi:MAG: 50S ribosomal protein L9 [Candidatus Abyssobacteria bacterium SURF_17]|uniref:Large ribosomal subunit protein bL9 n=1 Tax=Candidatus Abyssobacteria bacterium SURF_17 TaxID=2093361 RepID=A0A419EVT8_9BACT|nr:MAG: 50S ribosomal protein L9 [Candidatus Abyssubacteria bacterium SURF_17]